MVNGRMGYTWIRSSSQINRKSQMQISSAKCGAWMRLILECELSIYDLLCNATVQGQLRAAHNRVSNQERYSFTPGCDAYFAIWGYN